MLRETPASLPRNRGKAFRIKTDRRSRRVAFRSILQAWPARVLMSACLLPVAIVTAAPPAARNAAEESRSTVATPPAKGPVESIVEGMREAQSRLVQKSAGDETQRIQRRIIGNLEKLIEAAKQRSGGGGRSSSPSQSQNAAGDTTPQATAGTPPNGAASATAGVQPGHASGQGKPPVAVKGAPDAAHRALVREVWGHLPPAVREKLKDSDFGETILPAYDDLVRHYFEALLDGPSPRDSSSRGPDRPDVMPDRRVPQKPPQDSAERRPK